MQFIFHFWQILASKFKYICIGLLFLLVLFTAFWFRIQGNGDVPKGQFTENDAYLYYKQAGIITQQWLLPERDMQRWLPYGRDNGQLLTFYSYAIAYIHKILHPFIPEITLYQIQNYMPVVCFTLGLGVLLFFLFQNYGLFFALITGIILATVPGSVERSAIGFGDRDAFCWMFGVFVVVSYLWKEQLTKGKHRLILTVLSGVSVLFGGLSWEGFGVFLLIIMILELWKFCTTNIEQHLNEYLVWIGAFVPWLYIVSPIYRRGTGYATHVAALMLLPPIVILVIRGTRYLVLKYINVCQRYRKPIAWGLTLLTLFIGIGYCYAQYGTFETTAFSFRESALMQTMGELENPSFKYWTDRYGAFFVLGSIGLILASQHFGTLQGSCLGIALFLFTGTTFFRELIDTWGSTSISDILFYISMGGTAVALATTSLSKTDEIPAVEQETTTQRNIIPHKLILITMITWFILWVALARGGKRYDFFIGVPLAFGTATLLWLSPAFLKYVFKKTQNHKKSEFKEKLITTGIVTIILITIFFWIPLGGHVTRLTHINFKIRKTVPNTQMTQAITWLKDELHKNTVIAADWTYGMPINVLAGIRTIIDSDTFLSHQIHLYYRHVFCASSEKEALTFLKTHDVTHLLLTSWGVTSRALTYSKIGSNKNNDRLFAFLPLQRVETPIGTQYRMVPSQPIAPFVYIDFEKADNNTIALTTQLRDGEIQKQTISDPTTLKMVDLENGGLALFFDTDARLHYAYYIPRLGWNSLAIKLFLRGEHSEAFVPIYPIPDNETQVPIKIWKIRYPPDIKKNSKYLAIEPEDSDEH